MEGMIIIIKRNIKLLKPTGYMTHHQFNPQQLYALPTLYLCVLYLSENKQRFCHLQHKLIGFYNRDEVFTARYGLGL
jgi:hypothetical protein